MKIGLFYFLGIIFFVCVFAQAQGQGDGYMRLTSPGFGNNTYMPVKFTCEGQDLSPALNIENIPSDTKSLALIVDDPDAPIGVWVHWVVFDIPVINSIEENSIPGRQGINNAGELNYHGPCPPSGTHRYFFKVYALNTILNLKEGISKGALEKAMQGHILDKAELVGLYQKKGH